MTFLIFLLETGFLVKKFCMLENLHTLPWYLFIFVISPSIHEIILLHTDWTCFLFPSLKLGWFLLWIPIFRNMFLEDNEKEKEIKADDKLTHCEVGILIIHLFTYRIFDRFRDGFVLKLGKLATGLKSILGLEVSWSQDKWNYLKH